MAISTEVVTVTTSATLVASAAGATLEDTIPVTIRNDSGGTIYIGGAGVTTANGLAVPTASAISLDLAPGDNLYGIAASSLALQVFKQRS
jgi:hypothetical protein